MNQNNNAKFVCSLSEAGVNGNNPNATVRNQCEKYTYIHRKLVF